MGEKITQFSSFTKLKRNISQKNIKRKQSYRHSKIEEELKNKLPFATLEEFYHMNLIPKNELMECFE